MEGDLVQVEELKKSLDGNDGSHALAAGFKAKATVRAGRAGRVETAMAAGVANATVKFTRRVSGSRNIGRSNCSISRGTSESSPRISRNNSSISHGTSESSPRISRGTSNISGRSRKRTTSGINRDISRSSPHSIQGDRIHHAFHSGVVIAGVFYQSAAQYPLHQTRVFLTRTRARKLSRIHIQETTLIFAAELHHHQSHPPRRRAHMDRPSKLSCSFFTGQVTLAPFAPPGKSRVRSASVVGNVTVPGSYLHRALIVQSGSSGNDVRIADSGASCHMTHDWTRLYNLRPPPPGRGIIMIGNRHKLKVEYVENPDVIFHGQTDQRIALIDVVYVPGLGFNLNYLHAVLITHLIVSDVSGTHIIGTNSDVPPQQLRIIFACYPAPRRDGRSEKRATRHARN